MKEKEGLADTEMCSSWVNANFLSAWLWVYTLTCDAQVIFKPPAPPQVKHN